MLFTEMSGRSMHSVLVGLVCLAVASAICCSSVGISDNIIMCLESERDALLQFKQGLVDESDVLASWKSEKDCCNWRGIACNDQTGHVTTLNISFANFNAYIQSGIYLRGEISPSLLDLPYLNSLSLSFIDFEGILIPKFIGSLSRLKKLELQNCNFRGPLPPQLGNLSNLNTLDLSGNYFEGNMIPKFIGSLSQLRELRLAFTNFGGTILPQLGNLSNLHTLDLSSDHTGGTKISKFIGSLSQLRELRLADLGGPIPPQLGNLSNLHTLVLSWDNNDANLENLEWLTHLSSMRYLDIQSLNFSKVVNWPQSLSKLTSLRELHLLRCNLRDVNPISLSLINSSNSLQFLYLSGNFLSSSIFYWIANVSTNFVQIDLASNNLESGIPKGFQKFCSLEWLILENNFVSGNIEDTIKALSCSKNTLEVLDLSWNFFWGSIPDMTGFSKLSRFDLTGNYLTGSLPESIGQLSSLKTLDLSSNNLNGSLPESVGQLSSLETLHLDRNNLTGSLPESVGQLSSLETLDLNKNFMRGVLTESHFQNLSRLKTLRLNGNRFSMNISSDWNPPFQLSELYISNIKVGPDFPKWILTQTNIFELYLSNVGISNSLPHNFGDLLPASLDTIDLLTLKL